jgi:hypothetical protein
VDNRQSRCVADHRFATGAPASAATTGTGEPHPNSAWPPPAVLTRPGANEDPSAAAPYAITGLVGGSLRPPFPVRLRVTKIRIGLELVRWCLPGRLWQISPPVAYGQGKVQTDVRERAISAG